MDKDQRLIQKNKASVKLDKKITKVEKEIANLEKKIKLADEVKPTKPLTVLETELKKIEIEAKRKLSQNIGFRKLSQVAEEIKSGKYIGKKLTDVEKQLIHTTLDDIEEIGIKVEQEINNVKQSIVAVAKEDTKSGLSVAEDIANVYRKLHEKGVISKSDNG